MSIADLAYVLPLRRTSVVPADGLPPYLAAIRPLVGAVIVADGSPPGIFAEHGRRFPAGIVHCPVPAVRGMNGKVLGVCEAMCLVTQPFAVIADDDVRYDAATLTALREALDDADLVIPQNVFRPRVWHALLDEGRTLIARALGGDWPGTLGVRSAAFRASGAYRADVLFENLELVRTIRGAGGAVVRRGDLFVTRLPPSSRAYLRQRVRQAYDEFARPGFLAGELALAPALALLVRRAGAARARALFWLLTAALAESGRSRARGRRAFSVWSAVCAPVWAVERALCSWIAAAYFVAGGIPYAGTRMRRAAYRHRSAGIRTIGP